MRYSVIFAGFGGQGVLTAGLVLAQMGVDAGYEVLWSPAYGGEMRGGKAYSMVKLSDAPILDPVSGALDALVAMNGPALDFCRQLAPGGTLIVNATVEESRIPEGDWRVIRVPLQELADRAENARGANLAAVGCAAGQSGLFARDAAAASVERYFAKKGKAGLGRTGAAALLGGWTFCEEE